MSSRFTSEQDTDYLFQLALDWMVKVSFRTPARLELLRSKLQAEAATSEPDDSLALNLLDRVCEAYIKQHRGRRS
jgi:hypothetical protein